MIYLVTGSHGFVGSHLRQYLEARGDTFIGVPRSVFLDPLHLERFAFDVKPDVIVNLAAYGNLHTQHDVVQMLEANYTGTFNLLQVTKDMPYKALINMSSSSVTLPYETFYSATKAGAERLCHAFADKYNKPILSLRPYSVYGEGDHLSHFIPTVFRSCLEGETMTLAPEPVHDWVYVSDVVKAITQAVEVAENKPHYALSIGTGEGTTNQSIVDRIERITGKKAKVMKQKRIRAYDSDEWVADAPWDKRMTDIESGLKRYYEWYTKEKKGGEK